MKLSAPELMLAAKAILGEGPAWDDRDGVLYWVNIPAGEIHRFSPIDRSDRAFSVGEQIGCVAPAQAGLIVAAQNGVAKFDPADPALRHWINPEPHLPGNRFNDGKCDPRGRLIAGTMDDSESAASGSVYAFEADGEWKILRSDTRISNGIAWSPDHKTMYYIDTPTRCVTAFDYDLENGLIANERVVVTFPEALGWPDGMTSDRKGRLWVGMWGGSAITVWENGKMIERIAIPAINVTSCAFGGKNMNELYITSARKGLSEAELKEMPLTGGLFRVITDIEGMPTFRFGG
jgi:sugar lactone lactonase YvrE